MMSNGDNSMRAGQGWESAHICPKCGFVIALSTLDLGAVTTGIVECPRCEWAGRIEIKVVEAERLGG
jgi:hypothetical protein